MIVKRLHELTEAQAESLRTLMRSDIDPANLSAGSTWVCQELQRPHYWEAKMFSRIVEQDKLGEHLMAWVALDPDPAGIVILHLISDENVLLFTFFVDSSRADQWKVADAIALVSLKEMWAKKRLVSWFPEHSRAADYARRCGFRSLLEGTPMKPNPNPILFWEIGIKELKANIEALQ